MSATTSRTSSRTPSPRAQRTAPTIEIGLTIPAARRMPAPAPPPARDLLLPNVVIPGVSHSGAAKLAADLGRHPEVCLPTKKRIGHFTPLRYGRAVETPLEEYERHFSRWAGQRYRVETGPDYFDGGLPMARQVAESLPDARVVLVLRDPAHRLWAGYTDKLDRGRLPRAMGFETYVERCLALRANGADRFEGNRHFRTFSSGFYIEYLPAWLDTFGRRARVVFTEDLQEEPGAHVGALFDWLGLNPATVVPPSDDAGPGYPQPEPAALGFNRRLWPVLQRTPGPWRDSLGASGTTSRRLPRQSERVRARVRSLYATANRELAALLSENGYTGLPEWLSEA